jgi:protein-disulfide isomerase
MKRSPLLALLVMLALSSSACGQAVSSDDSAERKAQILANLVHEFPQLAPHSVEIGTIEPSGVPGLDQGEFTINGQQTQRFLLTGDDTRLFLLAGDPVDVSRSADELAEARAEQEAAAADEARERKVALDALAAERPVRGNPDAPVTIVEFSDFQCPYCARAFATVEQVLEAHGDDVRLIYLQYPLPNHPWARPASIAALCAAQQDDDAFWALHDGYFENQRTMTTANVLPRSREFLAGSALDVDTWAACAEDASSDAHRQAVAALEQDMALAQRYGVTGTPGFFVNGRFLNGAQPFEAFDAVIQEAKGDS